MPEMPALIAAAVVAAYSIAGFAAVAAGPAAEPA